MFYGVSNYSGSNNLDNNFFSGFYRLEDRFDEGDVDI